MTWDAVWFDYAVLFVAVYLSMKKGQYVATIFLRAQSTLMSPIVSVNDQAGAEVSRAINSNFHVFCISYGFDFI